MTVINPVIVGKGAVGKLRITLKNSYWYFFNSVVQSLLLSLGELFVTTLLQARNLRLWWCTSAGLSSGACSSLRRLPHLIPL